MKKNQDFAPFFGIFRMQALMVAVLIVFTGCGEEDENFVAVSDISGTATEAGVNSPLTLSVTVSPSNATNQTIVRTIKDAGTTGGGDAQNRKTERQTKK